MPLSSKEEKIMRSMVKKHGKKAGKRIFYASATKGVLGSKIKKRHGSRKGKKRSKRKK